MTALVESPATQDSVSSDWAQPVPELFDPLGLTATLGGQWLYLPAVGAAFIMQGMHPVIGDVTDRYSVADRDPAGRAIRSFDAVQQWIFGGKAAIEQGYWLRTMHRPLQMQGETGSRQGKHVSALDPEAYAWVIATSYVAGRRVTPRFLGRDLTDEEDERLFQDNRLLARITQVPERGYPTSRAEFWEFYDRMVEQVLINHPAVAENLGKLVDPLVGNEDSPLARRIPRWVPSGLMAAALKPVLAPISRVFFVLTFGAMDQRVRGTLGVAWSERDERLLRRFFAVYRAAYRVLPERVTYSPLAYHAREHQRVINRMRGRELTDFAAHDKGEPSAVRRSRRGN
ncbi:oxygenase MpaB family protein [Mycobacterium sp. D16R24]|uniref:oxygenase MpaB family protein n=1 Tax=Mycobacterium sp. D16R24 TaxID=1855656 RepID=UPI00158FF61F|nr:oxygenase MpaB family protein [Mycobacterium sp. D16R24]